MFPGPGCGVILCVLTLLWTRISPRKVALYRTASALSCAFEPFVMAALYAWWQGGSIFETNHSASDHAAGVVGRRMVRLAAGGTLFGNTRTETTPGEGHFPERHGLELARVCWGLNRNSER